MANGSFRLMLVTDRTLAPLERLPAVIAAAVEGGVDAVQVREPGLSQAEVAALVAAIREAIGGEPCLLVSAVHGVIRGIGTDGVHLPEIAPPLPQRLRDGHIVGRSVHSNAAARAAQDEGCDYLVLGTIFPSRSHPNGRAGGLPLVREVTDAVRIPVIGIGGIAAANAGDVIRAGASGVAVISAILAAPDPRLAAAELRQAVDEALRAPVGGQA
jgi:thiamine-phosphate pyrophosphorylase